MLLLPSARFKLLLVSTSSRQLPELHSMSFQQGTWETLASFDQNRTLQHATMLVLSSYLPASFLFSLSSPWPASQLQCSFHVLLMSPRALGISHLHLPNIRQNPKLRCHSIWNSNWLTNGIHIHKVQNFYLLIYNCLWQLTSKNN